MSKLLTKNIYSNAPNLKYWQGIRYLSDNYYIIVGTNKSGQGILYIGDLLNYDSNNNYLVNYPESSTTSVYGPDYIGNATYRLVGSYQKDKDQNIYGLFYQGTIKDLENYNNYKTVFVGSSYTFVHSTMENILVGNYDEYNLGPIQAFLMIIDIGKVIKISYPGSKSNTVYGVWYNGDSTYTLCGGYSDLNVIRPDIYKDSIIIPFGKAYLVNYNILTGQFSNWTTFNYPYSIDSALTHFQGISSNDSQKYQLAGDTVYDGKIITSYIEVSKDKCNNFTLDKWIDFSYPLPGNIATSSNSVSKNVIVGTYVDINNSSSAFQLSIE